MLPRDFGQFKLIWSIRQAQIENFTPSCNPTGHTLEPNFQHDPEPKDERHSFGDVAWNFPFKACLRAYWAGYLREQLRSHNSGNKFALTAPDRVKVSKWVSMAWDELSSTTIAIGYKKALGPLLDDADIAAADLIENLSRHSAIDADIGEVDSDDDIEVNEVDEE
ncbi:hypothetical protein PI124_g13358 [Phytophthora idaei]|nr:hypothetical protein PI124_g13358 [Phytophthora idaei]